MSGYKLRKRTERALLCTALDEAADDFEGDKFQTLDKACKAIHQCYPADLDVQYQLTATQIRYKLRTLALNEKNTKVITLLKDWESKKLGFGFYRRFLEENEQNDDETPSNTAAVQKLKLVKTRAPAGAEESTMNRTMDDGHEDTSSSSLSVAESDAEDETYTDRKTCPPPTKTARKENISLQSAKIAPPDTDQGRCHPLTNTSRKENTSLQPGQIVPLDSSARSTVSNLQLPDQQSKPTRLRFHLGYGDPPNHQDIANELDAILRRLDQGIHHFREVRVIHQLSASRLTNDALVLSRELLRPSADRTQHAEQNLNALFGHEDVTIGLIFRGYAVAAVNKWVFSDFVEHPDSQIHISILELDRGVYERARAMERTRYLDSLKATVTQQAANLEHKLLDILNSLRAPATSYSITQQECKDVIILQDDIERRGERHALWQDQVRSAFSQALNLRIKLARSPMDYVYRLPFIGSVYDRNWMESVHDDKSLPECPIRVLICLRPAIYSSFDAELVVIVPALVMLQGLGAPSARKLPSLG